MKQLSMIVVLALVSSAASAGDFSLPSPGKALQGLKRSASKMLGIQEKTVAQPAAPAPAPVDPQPEKIEALAKALLKNKGYRECDYSGGDEFLEAMIRVNFERGKASASCFAVDQNYNGLRHRDFEMFKQSDLGSEFMTHTVGSESYLLFKPYVPQTINSVDDLKRATVTPKDIVQATTRAFVISQERAERREKKKSASDLADIQREMASGGKNL